MTDNSQICAFKANLQCCKACPKKLHRKLQKIKGVCGINIDTEGGLVILSGSIGPTILKRTLEQIGIMAEILANDKNPLHAENLPIDSSKDYQSSSPSEASDSDSDHSCDGDSDSDQEVSDSDSGSDHSCDEDPDDDEEHSHGCDEARYDPEPQRPNSISWHCPHHAMIGNHRGPIPAFARSRSVYPNNHPIIYNRPPPHYVKRTSPPLPYPFSIYEQREPKAGNTFHHAFSDENVGACTIM